MNGLYNQCNIYSLIFLVIVSFNELVVCHAMAEKSEVGIFE